MIFIGGGVPVSSRASTDMAAALRRFFTRRPVATESRCPCTDPDKKQFPAAFFGDALPGEFELPTAGDFEWLLFSYT